MFALTIPLSSATIANLKSQFTQRFPYIKSSHRCEAIARGLGFGSHAALLAKVKSSNIVAASADGKQFSAYLKLKGFYTEPSDFYIGIAAEVLRILVGKHPNITRQGIGIGRPATKIDGTRESIPEFNSRFAEEQSKLFLDGVASEFLRALSFVQTVRQTRTIRTNARSYDLKHLAEDRHCLFPEGGLLGPKYVSNGAFIAAAIHAGFRYRVEFDHWGYEELNVTFNMSKQSLDDLRCTIRPNGDVARRRREMAEWRAFTRSLGQLRTQ